LSGLLAFETTAFSATPTVLPENLHTLSGRYLRGEITFREEAAHQTLDGKTIDDLELQALAGQLQEYAPSQAAKERITWLLTHPYLSAEEISFRQRAIYALATDDALFDLLEKTFTASDPSSELYGSRYDLITQFLTIKGIPINPVIQVGAAAGAVYWSESSLKALAHLNAASTPFSVILPIFGILMSMTVVGSLATQFRSSLVKPSAQTFLRADQVKAGNSDLFYSQPDELLREIGSVCNDSKACAATFRTLRLKYPHGKVAQMFFQLFGFPIFTTLPAAVFAQMRASQVIKMIAATVELETLFAFAKYFRTNKDALVFPTINTGPVPVLRINEGYEPYTWLAHKAPIPNSVNLSRGSGQIATYIITGPTMGGKTTFQQMALKLALMAQIGLPVPADAMEVSPLSIYTNFTRNSGKIEDGSSTFRAQASRLGEVLNAISSSSTFSILAMDEILRATSKPEHQALERGTLHFLSEMPTTLGLLATQDRSLTTFADRLPGIGNLQVSTVGHRISEGPSTVYNSFDVMADAGVPERTIGYAREYFQAAAAKGAPCEPLLQAVEEQKQ
jgi:hypothetical protein